MLSPCISGGLACGDNLYQVEAAFEAGQDARREIVHPGETLGLAVDQIAAPADPEGPLRIELDV